MTAEAPRTARTETLSIPRPDAHFGAMAAYLARPAGTSPHPGVVVIHEIWGLNENIRDIADRFASEGYVALAVDLFSGMNRAVCLWRLFRGLVIRPLRDAPLAELRRAVDVLQARPEVDPTRVGVIGFCMGGSYALQLACVDGDVRVASVYYGWNPRPLAAVARACPIVGSYPELDRTTVRDAPKLELALTGYGVPHDIMIYPGTKHAFANDRRPSRYNPAAAEDARRRTLAFFEQHLGSPGSRPVQI